MAYVDDLVGVGQSAVTVVGCPFAERGVFMELSLERFNDKAVFRVRVVP